MPADYLRNIAKLSTPAAVHAGRVVFNAAAEMTFLYDPLVRQRWIECLDAVRVGQAAHEAAIGRWTIVFFPIFGSDDRLEAVVGTAGCLADVPRLLHVLQKETPYSSEILNQAPHIVLTARPSGRIDYLSRRWYEVTLPEASKGDPEELLSKAIDPSEYRRFALAWTNGIASGAEFAVRVRIRTRSGDRNFELRARPVRPNSGQILKWVCGLTDVEDLVTSQDRFRVLADVGRITASARTLDQIADGLARLGKFREETWFAEIHHPPAGVQISRNLAGRERGLVVETVTRGERQRVIETQDGHPRSFVVAPIESDANRYGFVGYVNERSLEVTSEELTLLGDVASRAALAIERILRSLREQELTRMLQRSMLPLALPYSAGLRLDVAYEPAEREALVGGDWYDAFELDDGLVAVAIGDVAGHGFDAAVVMNGVRQAMRAAAFEDPDPAKVLAAANRLLNSQGQPMVTALFGTFDPLTLSFTFASAGHPCPMLVEKDGNVRELSCGNLPLGVADDVSITSQVEQLPSGGALVLYTDGVVEDERNLLSGERALRDLLSRWALGGFGARAAELQAQLRVGSHQDDAAMFVIRFEHVDEYEMRLPATPKSAQRMRLAARRFVSGSRFDPDRAFDVVLAVGEAVNNAVLHAYGSGSGSVQLALRRQTDRLIVEVRDEGRWREPESQDRLHGLGIIERLADSVDISRTAQGTLVHVEIAYSSSRAGVLTT